MLRASSCFLVFYLGVAVCHATNYYVAPDGNAANSGTDIDNPTTIRHAQAQVQAGDVIYFRGGTYAIQTADQMSIQRDIYSTPFLLDKSGNSETERICYYAYPGETPIIDMSGYKPTGYRVSAFYVTGSFLHIRGLEVVGTQVVVTTGNTQSECFTNRGGNNNIYERLKMHDGMAIGFYLTRGKDNLVLNCDAYNNYDANVDQGGSTGGNVDGFGMHPDAAGNTGNVMRGCRAWRNSDDGFDLINSMEAVTLDGCWAMYNGYMPVSAEAPYNTTTFKQSGGDGNGLKAGGYGMNVESSTKAPDVIPMHVVTNCLAYRNSANGFYANHHLGGNIWINNTACQNDCNFNMVNRQSVAAATDVAGYGHIMVGNLSHSPRRYHQTNVNTLDPYLTDNSFAPSTTVSIDSDFLSVDPALLFTERNADGNLPVIDFLRPADASSFATKRIGYSFTAPDAAGVRAQNSWHTHPSLIVSDKKARLVGGDAFYQISKAYVDTTNVQLLTGNGDMTTVNKKIIGLTVSNGVADLSAYTGVVTVFATTKGMTFVKVVDLGE